MNTIKLYREADYDTLEKQLALELQKRKLENLAKEMNYKKIVEQSDEVKELKNKLKTAYMNKERAAQLAEKNVRKLEERQFEADIEEQVLYKRELEQLRQLKEEEEKRRKRLQAKDVLQDQMKEREQLKDEARQQYLKEKDQVDQIMLQLINEDKMNFEMAEKKKAEAYQSMLVNYQIIQLFFFKASLAEKQQKIQKEKEIEQLENQRYLEFIKQKEKIEQDYKEKKAVLEKIKQQIIKLEQIFLKLQKEDQERKQEKERLENLRADLYTAEYDEKIRLQTIAEQQKREYQKQQMIEAERLCLERKAQQKEEEKQLEQSFRQQMMDKFAMDDKLEQMNQQKRRMKELEHKREVERLWQIKLESYKEQQRKEQEEIERQKKVREIEEDVIKMEKERLLREHLGNLEGFLPKGIGEVNEIKKLSYISKMQGATKSDFKLF